MSAVQIPLQAVKSQTVAVQLGGQSCRIKVHTRTFGLFVDLYVNDALVIGGVLALNNNRIVRSAYLGFTGDLYFWDTQGSDDPDYTGLSDRFELLYDEAL